MAIIRNIVILVGTFCIANMNRFDVLADEEGIPDRNEAQCKAEFSDCGFITNPGCGIRLDDTIVQYATYCEMINEYCRPGNKIKAIANCPSGGDVVERDQNTCLAQFSDCKFIYNAGCAEHVNGQIIRFPKYCQMIDQYCKPGNQSMSMTKAHKEIALFLVQLAEKETVSESTVIKEIGNKTEELLSQLRSLATVNTDDGRKMVTLQVLQERKFSQAVKNFLFQLALAENILML